MENRKTSALLPLALLGMVLLTLLSLYRMVLPAYQDGLLLRSPRWMAVGGAGLLGLAVEVALLAFVLAQKTETLLRGQRCLQGFLRRLGRYNLLLFSGAIGVYAALLLGRYGKYFEFASIRLLLFVLLAATGYYFLQAAGLTWEHGKLLAGSILISAVGYKIASYLPGISTFPFSLGWSEASRYYYASLFFSQRIYGMAVPPSVLHPSRYLLQAIPFLVPESPLWLHRLWQVILWLTTSAGAAYCLARRLAISGRFMRRSFLAWTFLFLQIGPVYYHLLVPVMLVLVGTATGQKFADQSRVRRRAFWQTLGVVTLASAWAGISRVNWFPLPGMLAATLYLLETHFQERPVWKYILPPAIWIAVGGPAALASQALYALLSGNPARQFTTSFTSDLLWYRLLPNATYPLGVLPAVLLVTLPFGLLIFEWMATHRAYYHLIRYSIIGTFLCALFLGGLVVSAKIGGGSNLHNLDAYLTLLLVAGAYLVFDKAVSDRPLPQPKASTREAIAVPLQGTATMPVVLALLIVAFFTLTSGESIRLPASELTQRFLDELRNMVGQAVKGGGEVLFLSERHLLTFGYLEDVPLVPDYEKVFLMEMAMAGDPEYLGRFHADIQARRYAMIVSEPLLTNIKGRTENFPEENNAWVEQVSRPILCAYEPLLEGGKGIRVDVLVPRPGEEACP